MPKKIIAVTGSYRRDGITAQAVDALLEAARDRGVEVKNIRLADVPIEFCRNCRSCVCDDRTKRRGTCQIQDGLSALLDDLDSADGIVLAAPVNYFTVTALMKRFLERLVVYSYWPWGQRAPVMRIKDKDKKAVVMTSSGCPAFIARIFMPHARQVLKIAAGSLGCRCIEGLHFGSVAQEARQRLTPGQLARARQAGERLLS